MGDVAVFNPTAAATLPSPLTPSSIYTDENQGKLQVVAPLDQFASITTTSFTNLLKLEGPSPALVLRNTRNAINDGNLSPATIQFNYEQEIGTTIRGALAFTNGKFFLEHDRSVVLSTDRNHMNVLGGAFGVYSSEEAKVSYFNFNNTINSTRPTFEIARGVQINGNLYIDASSSGTANKLTVNGTAEITGDTTLTNLEVLGQLNARNSVMQWSDSNLKTDIRPIEDALDKVMRMNGHTFMMKNQVGPTHAREMGLIAQEVALVIPEVVRPSTEGNLAVAYGNLAGVFVEAIKELTNKVTTLTATVSDLQAEITKMKASKAS
jgi:hypothetical protein